MAKIRRNRAKRWGGSFSVVSINPDGTVRWPPKWTVTEKRNYLESTREAAFELYPEDFDPNGGTLGILAKAVEKAEAEERRDRARTTLPEFPDSASVPLVK